MAHKGDDKAEAELLLNHVVARLTREAANSEQKTSARTEKRRRNKVRVSKIKLGIVLPLFLALTAINVTTDGVPNSLRPGVEPDEQQLNQNALEFAVSEIELYRDENGRLPSDLAGVDIPEFGEWRYERRDDTTYRVELTDTETSLVYDSSRNAGSSMFEGGTK